MELRYWLDQQRRYIFLYINHLTQLTIPRFALMTAHQIELKKTLTPVPHFWANISFSRNSFHRGHISVYQKHTAIFSSAITVYVYSQLVTLSRSSLQQTKQTGIRGRISNVLAVSKLSNASPQQVISRHSPCQKGTRQARSLATVRERSPRDSRGGTRTRHERAAEIEPRHEGETRKRRHFVATTQPLHFVPHWMLGNKKKKFVNHQPLGELFECSPNSTRQFITPINPWKCDSLLL